MNPEQKLLIFFIDLIPPLAIGYLLKRWRLMRQQYFDGLMVFNILVMGTLLALLSFWAIRLKLNLLWMPFLGVLMQVIPGAIGLARTRRKFESPLDSGSYVLSAMLSNRGTVGMLTVFVMFGVDGYAYARLVMLFASVVVYFFCFPMARHYYEKSRHESGVRPPLRSILLSRNQVPVIGLAAGLALNLLRVERPAVLTGAFPTLVHISVWLFLIPVGFSTDFSKMKVHWAGVLDLLPLKFLVTPAVTWACSWAVGLRGPELVTVTVLSMAPTAINSVVVARLNNLNINLAMAAFMLTTAVYIAVIFPLVYLLWTAGII